MSTTNTDDKQKIEKQSDDKQPIDRAHAQAYWRANIRLMCGLLVVWFVVSFGFGILAVEPLNTIQFFGFKFGFWWAQQGSIYVFVVLIFVYAWRMRKIDRQFGVDDKDAS